MIHEKQTINPTIIDSWNLQFKHSISLIQEFLIIIQAFYFAIKAQRKQTLQLHIKYLFDPSLNLMPMEDT